MAEQLNLDAIKKFNSKNDKAVEDAKQKKQEEEEVKEDPEKELEDAIKAAEDKASNEKKEDNESSKDELDDIVGDANKDPEPEEVEEDDTRKVEIVSEALKSTKDKLGETMDELFSETLDLDPSEVDKKKADEDKKKKEKEENDKELKELAKQYRSMLGHEDNVVDLTKFKISKKPQSVSKFLSLPNTETKMAVWGLYNEGRAIAMTEASGAEIQAAAQVTGNEDVDNARTYSFLHKHVVDKNKGNFEDYISKISIYDISHWAFALYRATYAGANYISYACPHCQHKFLKDIDVKTMVKFKDDKVKERMKAIINKDINSKRTYSQKLIAINNRLVLAISIPSIYKMVFEQNVLSAEFRRNHSDLMNILSYVDDIYKIDSETKMLYPVDTKPDADDHDLTVKRRLATFGKILMGLTSDEYSAMEAKVYEYLEPFNNDDGITYVIPEVECPECHGKIEETPMHPLRMLFMRHQLGLSLSSFKG